MVDVESHEEKNSDSFDWNGAIRQKVVLLENNGVNYSRALLRREIKGKNYRLVAVTGPYDDIYVNASVDYYY